MHTHTHLKNSSFFQPKYLLVILYLFWEGIAYPGFSLYFGIWYCIKEKKKKKHTQLQKEACALQPLELTEDMNRVSKTKSDFCTAWANW